MITILPPKLKILSFPRSQSKLVTHAIAKILLFENANTDDYFFSFTENEYGITIIANEQAIEQDFLPILQSVECVELDAPAGIFRVLQVDDERGQELAGSGKRISEISEPLTRGKFSILYISTYQTDFVLVSEPKLYQVMEALREDGFEIESPLPEEKSDKELNHFEEDEGVLLKDKQPPSPITDPSRFLLSTSVLVNELQCVGLNKHGRSIWEQTVLKILCYPELVQSDCRPSHKRFCSFVATNEDISIIADQQIIATFDESSLMLEQDAPIQKVIQVHFSGSNIERCGIVRSISKPLSIDANINMLYLSTFMTANIIVSADDLEKAVNILSPQKDLLVC